MTILCNYIANVMEEQFTYKIKRARKRNCNSFYSDLATYNLYLLSLSSQSSRSSIKKAYNPNLLVLQLNYGLNQLC